MSTPSTSYGIPWGLLNQTVTRKRPVFSTTSLGNETVASYDTQTLQMRVLERRVRGSGTEAEFVRTQGLIYNKAFLFDCNFYTTKTSGVPTDLSLGDRVVITDGTNSLECRIAELYDAAGQRHHISGVLVWHSPTGD
jgi:hypothetical protein